MTDSLPLATQWLMDASSPDNHPVIAATTMIVVGNTGSKGSGWLVSPIHVVTNEHVVHGAEVEKIAVHFSDGRVVPVKSLPIASSVVDLAVLELSTAVATKPLRITSKDVRVGDHVAAWGFPLAYNGPAPLLTAGYVAGFESRSAGSGSPARRLVLNAALNNGNSGGPVVGWNAASVLGVVVSKHAPIPAHYLKIIDAMKKNQSGAGYTYTDPKGKVTQFVESQLVAELLSYFRSMTQVVIGEAIPAASVIDFLNGGKIPWDPE